MELITQEDLNPIEALAMVLNMTFLIAMSSLRDFASNISEFIRQTRKGQIGIGDIGPIALSIGVAVIVVAVVAMILGTMSTNVTDGNATLVLTKGLEAMVSFADWFGIIVIVVVSVIILAIVMLLRGTGRGGKQ